MASSEEDEAGVGVAVGEEVGLRDDEEDDGSGGEDESEGADAGAGYAGGGGCVDRQLHTAAGTRWLRRRGDERGDEQGLPPAAEGDDGDP